MLDLTREAGDGSPVLDVVAPIPSGINAVPVGVVILRADPTVLLFPLIQVWPGVSPSGETLLVRREGSEVVYLNELRHRNGAALNLRMPLAEELPAGRAVQGKDGFFRGRDYRGEEVLASVRAIPETGWGLVAKVDAREVFSPVRRDRVLSLVILAAGVLAAVGWARAGWRKQQTEALEEALDARVTREGLERRLATLADQARDILILLTEDLRIAEVNNSAVEVWGRSRGELIGRTLAELGIVGEEVSNESFRRPMLSRDGLHETVHLRKDGSKVPVEISSRAMTLEGKPFSRRLSGISPSESGPRRRSGRAKSGFRRRCGVSGMR